MDQPTVRFISEPSLEKKDSRARHLLQAEAKSNARKHVYNKKTVQRRQVSTDTTTIANICCDCESVKIGRIHICKRPEGTVASLGQSTRSGLLQVPRSPVSSQHSTNELRALLFYREKTSVEWSGELDHFFWTNFVQSVAEECQAVRWGMIALATAHEGLELQDERLQRRSMLQAGKSVSWINDHHQAVSWPAWMTHCIIIAGLTALINPLSYLRYLKVLVEILHNMKTDEHNLRSLIERLYCQHCQQLAPLELLRRVTIDEPQWTVQVRQFSSLMEARQYLEQVLNTLAFQVKNQVPISRNLLSWWLKTFTQLRGYCNSVQWRVLRAAYGMSVIQIDMLNSTSETDYDQYLEVFTEVADMYEAVLHADTRTAQYRFPMDTGSTCLVGWAASWCREPLIRARLITLLLSQESQRGNLFCRDLGDSGPSTSSSRRR